MEYPAVVLEALGQLPRLETVTVHNPGPDEVAVRMAASGICHTDIGYMQYARACPVLLGHEGAGVVEQVGANVTHIQPGDHVVINWQVKCNRCRWCLSGRQDLCENVQGTAAPRFFWRDEPLNIMLNAGTFCPVAIVPAMGAIPIRRDMPLEKAALLGCAVATGVGAVLYTARVQPGENVVVIGAGGVGLNIIQGARLANAGFIIAIDLNDENLGRAASVFGATHTLNSRETDPAAAVREITGGRGVEHVFEVVGLPVLMQQGINMLARGGTLTLVGAAEREAQFSFHPRRFMSMQQWRANSRRVVAHLC
ncbi:MAG: alcohol dehydrogenase [Chloroflexi bacterium]|nr:alcohol dehydrogenase [Chloroflexota bacterium]MDL1885979.1 zinc-binding dehydrogenase [Anaerolineae bacterium CFX8]